MLHSAPKRLGAVCEFPAKAVSLPPNSEIPRHVWLPNHPTSLGQARSGRRTAGVVDAATSLPLKPVAFEQYQLSSADTILSISGVAEQPSIQTSYPTDLHPITLPPMSESLEWVSSFVGDAPPGEVRPRVPQRH